MKKFGDLINSAHYWISRIQHDVFELLEGYRKEKNYSRKELADEMGVDKSYISQVLNGNFNYIIKKLVSLALFSGRVPVIKFVSKEAYLENHKNIDEYFKNIERKDRIPGIKLSPAAGSYADHTYNTIGGASVKAETKTKYNKGRKNKK